MNAITLDTQVILWSHHDKLFHVETLREYVTANLDHYFASQPPLQSLVGLAPSVEAAQELIDKLIAKKQSNDRNG